MYIDYLWKDREKSINVGGGNEELGGARDFLFRSSTSVV